MFKRLMMIKWAICVPYMKWEKSIRKVFRDSKQKYEENDVPMWFLYVWCVLTSPLIVIAMTLTVVGTFLRMVNYTIQGIIFGNIFVGFDKSGNPKIVRWIGIDSN